MTHTPGPWNALVDGTQSKCRCWIQGPAIDADGFRNIANISVWGSAEMQKANARLIAAAPELLEALKALTNTARTFRNVPKDEQEWTPIDDEALATALAAIAKAEGRG